MKHYLTALSIAGSDPSAGAGIQADLKTFSSLGVYGLTVPTVLTVQNTTGVKDVFPLPPELVAAQIDAVMSDIHPRVIKIGMTGNAAIIDAIVDTLQKYDPDFVVLDPIMFSSSGYQLLSSDGIERLKERLFPFCSLITPNLLEAQSLASIADIKDSRDAIRAGDAILSLGCKNVLIKGGHFESDPIDVLIEGEGNVQVYSCGRIETQNTHGTGCTLSSAIAAYIAKGFSLGDAVGLAKEYLTKALRSGSQIRLGQGPGPMNHFFGAAKLLIGEK